MSFAFRGKGPEMTRRGLIKGGAARAATAGVRTEADPLIDEAHSVGHTLYHLDGMGTGQFEKQWLITPHYLKYVEHAVKGYLKAERRVLRQSNGRMK